VSGATGGYELQYASTSGAVAGSAAIACASSQYQVHTDLDLGQWYWRVRAKNGDGVWGAWSSTWSFTVTWAYTMTPIPADGGSTTDTTPVLDWSDVSGATGGYELQYASTFGGVAGSTAIACGVSQYQYSAPLAMSDMIYWRVRAKNADSVWGAWSSTWSFVVRLLDMLPIPAGSFSNGTSTVTLSAFKMSKYEVTQSLYQTITGTNPSYFSGNTDAATCPVEQVTWYDAVEFCNKLSLAEGLQTVYTINSRSPSSGYPILSASVSADWTKNGYRLPTEAQWEYAARAGTTTAYYWGSASDDATAGQYAWYTNNSSSKTHGVGQKLSNAFGLYDMAGNVWEWCWDWYDIYLSGAQTNPTGASSGAYRIIRGNGWFYWTAIDLASARRGWGLPGNRFDYIGIRVVIPIQ
jgi:formylglycine-generating enzyme required for sulfatase activity